MAKILVIGDFMMDRYWYGMSVRNCPAYPDVPVNDFQSGNDSVGGAGNVYKSLELLGHNSLPLSVWGIEDDKAFRMLYPNRCGMFPAGRQSIVKMRVYEDGKLICRLDKESTVDISIEVADRLFAIAKNQSPDAIVFSDYDKGVCTPYLIDKVTGYANENDIPIFVDPKAEHFYEYKGATVFKINEEQAKANPNYHLNGHKCIVITRAGKGCSVLIGDGNEKYDTWSIPNDFVSEVLNTAGAGDVFLAVTVHAYLKDKNFIRAVKLAQRAATKSCTTPDTCVVFVEEIDL